MANYFSASSDSVYGCQSPLFYSSAYEDALLSQYNLSDSPSRSEFLASSPDSDSSDVSSVMNGNGTLPYESDPIDAYEQTLVDQYLPGWGCDDGGVDMVDPMVGSFGHPAEFGNVCSPSYAAASYACGDAEAEAEALSAAAYLEGLEDGAAAFLDVPYDGESASDNAYSPTPSPQPVVMKKQQQLKKPVIVVEASRQMPARRRPIVKQEYVYESEYSQSPSPPPRRSVAHNANVVKMVAGGVKKRGRPAGSTSTSKMALYSKQYREAKKNEASTLQQEIAALAEHNEHLVAENHRLNDEVQMLRRADAAADKLATLLATHRQNPGRFRLCVDFNGSPYLEVL